MNESKFSHPPSPDAEKDEKIRELTEENKRLHELATKDSLTGLYNRRGLNEAFAHLITDPKKSGVERRETKHKPVAVLILDIDNFKEVNDLYGHAVGDKILNAVAKYLTGTKNTEGIVRKSDIVGRWGGEEFAVVFRNADAQDIVNKFYNQEEGKQKKVKAEFNIDVEIDGEKMTITLSGGVVEIKPGENFEEAVARADKGLYAAKEKGKNRIEKMQNPRSS